MHRHKNVIKQADRKDEPEPVAFEDWVAAHAERVPAEKVEPPPSNAEKKKELGEARRGVIQGTQAREAQDSVRVYGNVDAEKPSDPADSESSEDEEDEEETRFGLSDEEFHELRAAWEEEWKQRMRERRETAREEGFEAGYEKARAEADEQIEELEALLHEGLDEMEAQRLTFFEHVETELAELSLEIAERILDAPLPHEMHDRVKGAVHDAVDELAGNGRTDITLHPADYLRMQESGLMEQLDTAYEQLHWHSDPELEYQGNWIVESPHGALRHLKEELLREIKTGLGLRDPGADPDADVESESGEIPPEGDTGNAGDGDMPADSADESQPQE